MNKINLNKDNNTVKFRYGVGTKTITLDCFLNEKEYNELINNYKIFKNLKPIIKVKSYHDIAYICISLESNTEGYIYYLKINKPTEKIICNFTLTDFLSSLETKEFYIEPVKIKEIKLSKKSVEKLNKLLDNNKLEKYFSNYEFVFDKKSNYCSTLQTFLTLDDIKETYSLYVSDERIPNNIIPIISDDAGNYLCLSVRKIDFGSVFFFHHDTYEDEKSLFKLAKSLEKFYILLKYIEN